MIKSGLDINFRPINNYNQYTPLSYCVKLNNYKLFPILLKNGAELDDDYDLDAYNVCSIREYLNNNFQNQFYIEYKVIRIWNIINSKILIFRYITEKFSKKNIIEYRLTNNIVSYL